MSDKAEQRIEKISPEFVSELQQMPNLRSQLPHRFAGGGAISGMSINCAACGNEVPDDNIHGHIEPIAGGEAVSIKAYAICYHDQIISPLEARYDKSGEALVKNANGTWTKSRWCDEEEQQQVSGGVKSLLDRHWQSITPPAVAVAVVVAWIASH